MKISVSHQQSTCSRVRKRALLKCWRYIQVLMLTSQTLETHVRAAAMSPSSLLYQPNGCHIIFTEQFRRTVLCPQLQSHSKVKCTRQGRTESRCSHPGSNQVFVVLSTCTINDLRLYITATVLLFFFFSLNDNVRMVKKSP